jgi:hypothetical protein
VSRSRFQSTGEVLGGSAMGSSSSMKDMRTGSRGGVGRSQLTSPANSRGGIPAPFGHSRNDATGGNSATMPLQA